MVHDETVSEQTTYNLRNSCFILGIIPV